MIKIKESQIRKLEDVIFKATRLDRYLELGFVDGQSINTRNGPTLQSIKNFYRDLNIDCGFDELNYLKMSKCLDDPNPVLICQTSNVGSSLGFEWNSEENEFYMEKGYYYYFDTATEPHLVLNNRVFNLIIVESFKTVVQFAPENHVNLKNNFVDDELFAKLFQPGLKHSIFTTYRYCGEINQLVELANGFLGINCYQLDMAKSNLKLIV